MGKRTGSRRVLKGLGGFLSASLIAGSVAIGLGTGVATAQVAATEGSSAWALAPNTAPSLLQQNTRGNSDEPRSGAGAGWSFTIQGDWDVGDTFTVSVDPGTYAGTKGVQCQVPYEPLGVNQSEPDLANYIGFSFFGNDGQGVDPPVVESTFPAGPAPTFDIYLDGGSTIPCSEDAGVPTYRTLVLEATNSGNGQASQRAIVNLGWSTNPPPPGTGPVMFDVGFGATTGPAFFTGGGTGTAAFAVESSVTVIGQRPSANVPRSTVVRSSATDLVGNPNAVPPVGVPISEFKITENTVNALPPTDGYLPDGLPGAPGAEDLSRHILNANPPGSVCLAIDNSSGNDIKFAAKPGWSVDPGASASPNSAAAGPRDVALTIGDTVLQLPVENSSNKTPTVWTTTGLSLTGVALADGPVWAYVWWLQGPTEKVSCAPYMTPAGAPTAPGVYTLGYVQLTTVSEVAPAVYGADAEATSAQAVNHQFDYEIGDCISNNVGPDYLFGPSIFLARSDFYADGLGAAYSAGSVDSGVLLTNPNNLNPQIKDTIRLQGAATVFVAGGPLAISDAVVNELKETVSYHCGGTQPRLDPNTGLPKKLVVIRIFGETLWDTNQRLAEFVGAQPPAAFGPFGATCTTAPCVGNPFNTAGGISLAGTPPASWVNTALLVTGENYQDAMVASVPAYGGDVITPIGHLGPMPLIATPSNSLSQQAINAMFNQHIQQLIVVGGPLAVSDAVINQAIAAIPGLSVIRIAGQTASETSVQLAMFELSQPLGMGWLNTDFDWASYVNRTAGNINFNTNEWVTANVVLLARGDYFADAMAAAAVLSIHNSSKQLCKFMVEVQVPIRGQDREEQPRSCQKFPLIITESPTTLGAAVETFLRNGSQYISTLTGAIPSNGLYESVGIQNTLQSSNVFTVQPVGGPLALSPALLSQVGKLIGG